MNVADTVAARVSYTLSKHVRWQLLLADLQQFFLNETFAENSSLQDLVKKVKTCITAVRLGQGKLYTSSWINVSNDILFCVFVGVLLKGKRVCLIS